MGLFALLRNEGGSFGTSMAQTLQVRRDQFHTWRMGEFLDPFNPTVSSYLEQAQAFFFQRTGDDPAQRMALQSLEDLRAQQAASLAYFDVFLVSAALAVGLAFLVLLMKRSVAEKARTSGANSPAGTWPHASSSQMRGLNKRFPRKSNQRCYFGGEFAPAMLTPIRSSPTLMPVISVTCEEQLFRGVSDICGQFLISSGTDG